MIQKLFLNIICSVGKFTLARIVLALKVQKVIDDCTKHWAKMPKTTKTIRLPYNCCQMPLGVGMSEVNYSCVFMVERFSTARRIGLVMRSKKKPIDLKKLLTFWNRVIGAPLKDEVISQPGKQTHIAQYIKTYR